MSKEEQSPLYLIDGQKNSYSSCEPTLTMAEESYRSIKAQKEKLESEKTRKKAMFALVGAMLFCFVFMIVEVVAGYISHSLAILTDATHLLTDVGAYMLSVFALYAAGKGSSKDMSYGWHRAEVVGTLGSVFTIWALVGVIVFEALNRITTMYKCAYHPKDVHPNECIKLDTKIMLIVGCLGLLVNMICAGILTLGGTHGHSHSGGGAHGHSHGGHDHGHSHGGGGCSDDEGSDEEEECGGHGHSHGGDNSSHGHTHGAHDNKAKKSKKSKKKSGGSGGGMALNAAFLHALGDCIQSVGVIIAGGFAYYMNMRHYKSPSHSSSPYNLADPLSSIFFAVITLYTTKNLIKELLQILMEATPPHCDYNLVKAEIEKIPGVRSVHDLHIWSIAQDKISLSVHLVADNHTEVLHSCQDICEHQFGITHTTIQVDPEQHGSDRCASNICS